MERSSLKRFRFFRVVTLISLCVTVVYCLRNTYSQTTLLCTEREVNYSRSEATETFSVAAGHLKYSQLLQDVLRSYQHSHAGRRRELVAGTVSRTLTWYCSSCKGGIGDRVKGIYTAFLLALVTNRTFFIHLSDEVQNAMFLEPSAIDWRPVHRCAELHKDQTLDRSGNIQYIAQQVFRVNYNFSLDFNKISKSNSIYITGFQDILKLTKHILSSEISTDPSPPIRRLLQSVLESGDGANLHSFLSILYRFLFHLSPQVQQLSDSKLRQLNLWPHEFVAVHIRTGFKNSLLGEVSLNAKYWKGVRFARTEHSWRNMIDCAIGVSDSRFWKNSTILVVSDDLEPKKWAASQYKSRVTMLDIDPVHVVASNPFMGSFKSRPQKQYLDTWVELSVMSQSSAIVSIRSGYSKVASYIGHMDPLSLYIYDISQKTCSHVA